MSSSRYRLLAKRLNELRRNLLPGEFDPVSQYSDEIYDRTLAFRVLAHAEFESFLEERALEHLRSALTAWGKSGSPSRCLVSLVAYSEVSRAEAVTKPQKSPRRLQHCINDAARDYFHYVRERNHGIKEENILRILLPLGIDEHDLKQQWLLDTNEWAKRRGESAHQTGRVQVRPDPLKELKIVRSVRRGFYEVDKLLL